MDLWFVPDDGTLAGAPLLHDDLAAMTSEPRAVEAWSEARSVHDFRSSMSKRDLFPGALELRNKRPWMIPMLWHLHTVKRVTVLRKLWFVPTGVLRWYRLPNPGLRVQIVALGELAHTRSMLLLRLLGRGRVRRDALLELPDDAWKKQLAYPWEVPIDS